MLIKILLTVFAVAALVGLVMLLMRKVVKHSAPLALACAIVLTVLIAPVWAAHAAAVLVVAGAIYVAIA